MYVNLSWYSKPVKRGQYHVWDLHVKALIGGFVANLVIFFDVAGRFWYGNDPNEL